MKKNHLLIFVLLLSLLGAVTSCKKSEKAVSRPLQSYKTEYSLQSLGQGGGTCVLEYDEQQRLTSWNNDSIRLHYAYRDNGDIDICGEFLRDGAKESSGTITLNEAGLPDVEKYSLFIVPVPAKTPVPQVMTYAYDEKNRLVRAVDKVDAGDYSYLIKLTFLYEGNDDNVTRMKFEWDGWGHTRSYYYVFEYLDKENPLEFYPELVLTTSMNSGLQITGKAGYKRSKLLKRMTRFDEEDVMQGAINFSYGYDADGNITECTLTRQVLNADGVMGGNEFLRFYEIKY